MSGLICGATVHTGRKSGVTCPVIGERSGTSTDTCGTSEDISSRIEDTSVVRGDTSGTSGDTSRTMADTWSLRAYTPCEIVLTSSITRQTCSMSGVTSGNRPLISSKTADTSSVIAPISSDIASTFWKSIVTQRNRAGTSTIRCLDRTESVLTSSMSAEKSSMSIDTCCVSAFT